MDKNFALKEKHLDHGAFVEIESQDKDQNRTCSTSFTYHFKKQFNPSTKQKADVRKYIDMGISERQSLLHWNYFLALEQDVERLSRYIEFTTDNFNTYSIEMAHILLAASSEVDVVAKILSEKLSPDSHANNIEDYRRVLDEAFPSLRSEIVTLPRHGLELTPWSNWGEEESPIWWRSHNKVKHQRQEHFDKANLKNVLNAMSGLFLLILHHYQSEPALTRIDPLPSLFTPPRDVARVAVTRGSGIGLFFTNKTSTN